MTTRSSERIDGSDDMFELFNDMCAKGFTDGLPVIPPKENYVRDMIASIDLPPHEEIAVIPPEGGIATIEKIAINMVMAGCLPKYFPAVIATIKAISEPQFNLLGIQTTTNPVSPMIVINGPYRRQVDLECGRGCMGNGFRANATIGRAVKLVLRNIGGCIPGDVSKSIHGMPGRYSFCFGELEEESPWEAFHVEMGYHPEESTVSVFGAQGTQNIYAGFLKPENIIHCVADGMSCYGNNGYVRGSGNPVVVFSPGHAKIFSQCGWSKARVKRELFNNTYIPLSKIPEEKQLSNPIYSDWDRSRSIQLCQKADDIVVLVAGGSEAYHVTYIPSFASTDMVIQQINILTN